MILIITPFFWPNVGGVETHLNDLRRYLANRNFKVQVLTYQPITVNIRAPREESGRNYEIRRYWWPGFNLFNKLEKLPSLFNFLYLTPGILLQSMLFAKKNYKKIQVVHSQGLVAGFVGLILKKLFGFRLIISTHAVYGFSNSFFSKVSFWVINSANRVLALSQASKIELIKIGVNPAKIKVYTYWVNQNLFKPLDKKECKDRTGLKNRFVVLFVGRLIDIKGADLLVEIAKKEPKMTFVFAGTGPEEEKLRKNAGKYQNIKFVGKINNSSLPLYYSAADLLVIPSKYEEGYGRVILEALSCGTPVVGSNRGGIKEAISAEVGVLIEPETDDLQKKLRYLYKNRQKINYMAKNCRSYALAKFSDKNGKVIVDAYFK